MLDQLAERETGEVFRCRVNGVVDSLSSAEAQVCRLMVSGVRAAAEYAMVLGMDGAPPGEQRRTVKRAKDRLCKRLRRQLRGATV